MVLWGSTVVTYMSSDDFSFFTRKKQSETCQKQLALIPPLKHLDTESTFVGNVRSSMLRSIACKAIDFPSLHLLLLLSPYVHRERERVATCSLLVL
jgi:hypothetical protein